MQVYQVDSWAFTLLFTQRAINVLTIDISQLEKAIDKQDTDVTAVLADLEEATQLADKIAKYTEKNWENLTKENFENADFLIFSVNFMIQYIESKLFVNQIFNQALKEAIDKFYETLVYVREVLNDAIQYKNAASEVSEILRYPRQTEKANRVKKIIERGKERAKNLSSLSGHQIQERLDGTWEAMLSEVEQNCSLKEND